MSDASGTRTGTGGSAPTSLDLAAIRARLAAATPGPWSVHLDGQYVGHGSEERGYVYHVVMNLWQLEADDEVAANLAQNRANAELIAHAPTDLAVLLAEVERLGADGRMIRAQQAHRPEWFGPEQACPACTRHTPAGEVVFTRWPCPVAAAVAAEREACAALAEAHGPAPQVGDPVDTGVIWRSSAAHAIAAAIRALGQG